MQQMIFIADFIACSTCLGTIMPIIRSSRVLYRWSLPVVFGAVKMEKVICRLGIICVFGIKCRVLYMLL